MERPVLKTKAKKDSYQMDQSRDKDPQAVTSFVGHEISTSETHSCTKTAQTVMFCTTDRIAGGAVDIHRDRSTLAMDGKRDAKLNENVSRVTQRGCM